jgi:glutathione synthase/RimK-type ligase-like ATP-grasp enzyme
MTDLIAAASQPFAPLIGVARLMRRAFAGADLRPLGAVLLARAQQNPLDANACLDLSTVLQLVGDRDRALAVQAEALRVQRDYALPSERALPALRFLVIMGPGDLMANTPVEFLVEDSGVTLQLLYLTLDAEWPETVPDHDVMMVAIAESAANQALLQRLAKVVGNWPRPVINLPERIAVLSRDGACAALAGITGVDMPVTRRTDRSTLSSLSAGTIQPSSLLPGDAFPWIVRPVGSHAGQHLEKIDDPADLADYLDRVGHDQFYVSRFVDYRHADGLFRKYRIVLIEGKAYASHLAVSSHWMIHYLNAGMDQSLEKRQQEAEWMRSFDEQFAKRHAAALAGIQERIGLDYLGIDCAETADGELLIFEVDNAMLVHAMDSEDLYPYKKPAMQKLFKAFQKMLENPACGTLTA